MNQLQSHRQTSSQWQPASRRSQLVSRLSKTRLRLTFGKSPLRRGNQYLRILVRIHDKWRRAQKKLDSIKRWRLHKTVTLCSQTLRPAAHVTCCTLLGRDARHSYRRLHCRLYLHASPHARQRACASGARLRPGPSSSEGGTPEASQFSAPPCPIPPFCDLGSRA